jgi:5-formyltetrahydrofolate cyclo-ligase
LAFETQVVDQLPTQPWDQSMDLVLTEQRII